MRWPSLTLLVLLTACPAAQLTPGACGECHTLDTSRRHMLNHGGRLDEVSRAWLPPSPAEICSRCHAPGKTNDVEVEHARSPRYRR